MLSELEKKKSNFHIITLINTNSIDEYQEIRTYTFLSDNCGIGVSLLLKQYFSSQFRKTSECSSS